MKKWIAMLLASLCLSSCCVFSVVNCKMVHPYISPISHYQKPNTIGYTDIEQRWRDAVSCGAKYGDAKLAILYGKDWRDERGENADRIINNFDQCMRSKGYVHLTPVDCQYNPEKCNY